MFIVTTVQTFSLTKKPEPNSWQQ